MSISKDAQPPLCHRQASARRAAAVTALGAICSGLLACSPYPDEGEFLAGVVFAGNFVSGVKTLRTTTVAARGFPAYTMIASSGTSATTTPLWREPRPETTQQVFVFDKNQSCTPPVGAPPYSPRLDLVRPDRQYPVFSDIPEVLSANSGRPGRTGAYSAVVEVVHIATPAGFPCQSVKRADTVLGRKDTDLKPVAQTSKEYRLLLIFDPALTSPPLPFQLGWFNQLVVPYLDMGPVPLTQDGKSFVIMPLYQREEVSAMGTLVRRTTVVPGAQDEAPASGAPTYSPICRDATLTVRPGDLVPALDAADPAYAKATPGSILNACLICKRTTSGEYSCPLGESGAGAR